MINHDVQAIEEFFRRRFGRDAIYLPSGRLALYLAFREWLRPGNRILMSPVNDDVVFFTVLAAGLVPVLAPLDPRTGNIDPTAIDDSIWSRLRGVMTTNLYGIPDRMDVIESQCRRHDLVLIEDACHALDSRFGGRRIGQFGQAAAFSFGKHLGTRGGVLIFEDRARRRPLLSRAHAELRTSDLGQALAYWKRVVLDVLGVPTATRRRVARIRDRLFPPPSVRSGYRMPYTHAEILTARKAGGGLNAFDQWVRVDNPAYRARPIAAVARMGRERLELLESERGARLSGTRRLWESGLTLPHLPEFAESALFRVPLFVSDRDQTANDLRGHNVSIDYIYDPPLDLYAPALAERIPSVPAARIWSRDVLPVDPRYADQVLDLMKASSRLRGPAVELITQR